MFLLQQLFAQNKLFIKFYSTTEFYNCVGSAVPNLEQLDTIEDVKLIQDESEALLWCPKLESQIACKLLIFLVFPYRNSYAICSVSSRKRADFALYWRIGINASGGYLQMRPGRRWGD